MDNELFKSFSRVIGVLVLAALAFLVAFAVLFGGALMLERLERGPQWKYKLDKEHRGQE